MKTKNIIIIAVVAVLVLALIIVANKYNLSGNSKTLAVGSDLTCDIIAGSRTNYYQCGSAFGCTAWIQDLWCNKQTNIPLVIARTNKDFSNPSVFESVYNDLNLDAIVQVDYDKSGVLEPAECYKKCVYGMRGGCSSTFNCGSRTTKILELGANYYFGVYEGVLGFCILKLGQSGLYWDESKYYKANCTTDNVLHEGSDIDGKNVIKAQTTGKPYYCKDYYETNIGGLTQTKSIQYAGESSGGYGLPESDAEILNKGDSISLKFTGTIKYKEKICSYCECTGDVKCYGAGYKLCQNKDSNGCGTLSAATYSCNRTGEICVNEFSQCMVPFDVHLEVGDYLGQSIDVFKPNQDINTRVFVGGSLADKSVKKDIVYNLYSGSLSTPIQTQKDIGVYIPMVPGEYKYKSWGTLPLGTYTMQAIIDGLYSDEKTFTISDDLCAYADFLDKTRFVTKKDIVLRIDTFYKDCVQRLEVTNYKQNIKLEALCDDKTVIPKSDTQIQAGQYEYTFNFDTPCIFSIKAIISAPNYPVVEIGQVKTIGQPSLNIKTNFPEMSEVKEYKLEFDILDEQGTLQSADATVKIQPTASGNAQIFSEGDIKGGGGHYYISVLFDHEDVYNVEISANKDGYSPANKKTTVDIIDINKCGNGVCDAGETNETCPKDCGKGIDWIKVFLYIAGILMLIGIIILIIFLIKKKKSDTFLGGF
jgi:hypothetical protein